MMWRRTPLKGGNRFTAKNIEAGQDMSALRWTVDEASDYLFLRTLVEIIGKENIVGFGFKEILSTINNNPKIQTINESIIRDEGYAKSLKKEK